MSELIFYRTEDGKAEVHLRAGEGTVWLTQGEIAELFATTKQNVSLHVRNILDEKELSENSVVKESLTTASDGKRYRTNLYRLEMILAIGYRVRSPRGTPFRDRLLEFNERPVLDGKGSISNERMKAIAHERYETFDENRRRAEAEEADEEDLRELEALEKQIKEKGDKH